MILLLIVLKFSIDGIIVLLLVICVIVNISNIGNDLLISNDVLMIMLAENQ